MLIANLAALTKDTCVNPEFTAHNIRLDNGVQTKPEQAYSMGDSQARHLRCRVLLRSPRPFRSARTIPEDPLSPTPRIADAILRGYYMTDARGVFIGIKTKEPNVN